MSTPLHRIAIDSNAGLGQESSPALERADDPVVASGSRSLGPLFSPASVAVVGASENPRKWGHRLARGALRGEHRRAVHMVNRRGGEILGRRAYAALEELPGPPELVVIALPDHALEQAVDEALAAGASTRGWCQPNPRPSQPT